MGKLSGPESFRKCKTMAAPYQHFHVVQDREAASAYMALVQRSNEATALVKRGQLAEAEAVLRDVLARKPGAGFDRVSVALTQQELGSVLRQRGALHEALALLLPALEVRERHDAERGVTMALRDGSVTRDEMAKVYEALGDCARALETREPGKRVCSSDACAATDYAELKACSRCKCVFYCDRKCQLHDWKVRHKPLCQPVPRSPAA